ncbi:epithelial splicing regulatory protein 1-like [Antedon mediterranea]|uniref:epithelial splicing regulatory protein 1-like n=1 Tax=Antedon mediterranea TaxID=105859 RepID=UPI003AF66F1E
MASPFNYLVAFFCTTAGQRGALLGSDEEEIILFVWVVVDVETNKVIAFQKSYVGPESGEAPEELCKNLGVHVDMVKGAARLNVVLQQFDQFLRTELNIDEGATLCLVTDGQLHLRQCLHPQASNKDLQLQPYFSRFFDLRKEFRKVYQQAGIISNVKDMADHMNIDTGKLNFMELGSDECQTMGTIVQKLIADGHLFTEPEIVQERYEPGTYDKAYHVPDEQVVKARGLPWQASDRDVFKFFKGLNVAKGGIALCLNLHGRRNGEVMVRFANSEQKDLALQRHRHNLGKRYVEVFRAQGEEFIKVAAGTSREAALFLSRDDGHIIVRMRGLPFTATAKEVVDFFGPQIPVAGGEDGILFVKQRNGKVTGDAFVLFSSEEIAGKALDKHKDYLGSRYIEIFRSTTAEVQQVLSRLHSEPLVPEGPPLPQIHPSIIPHHMIHPVALPPPPPQIIPAPMPPASQVISTGCARDCIRMRGLPFTATVEDIMRFLGEFQHFIKPQGVHMVYNMQGKPNGEAFIQMVSAEKAYISASMCHMKYIGDRYIEVFQCSADEMNYMLWGGVKNKHPQMSPPAGTLPPTTLQINGTPAGLPHHPAIFQSMPVPHPGARHTANPYIQAPLYYVPAPASTMSPAVNHLYYPPQAHNPATLMRVRGMPTMGATIPPDMANYFQTSIGMPHENIQTVPMSGETLLQYTTAAHDLKTQTVGLHPDGRKITKVDGTGMYLS